MILLQHVPIRPNSMTLGYSFTGAGVWHWQAPLLTMGWSTDMATLAGDEPLWTCYGL
jgi:hypothetical protein